MGVCFALLYTLELMDVVLGAPRKQEIRPNDVHKFDPLSNEVVRSSGRSKESLTRDVPYHTQAQSPKQKLGCYFFSSFLPIYQSSIYDIPHKAHFLWKLSSFAFWNARFTRVYLWLNIYAKFFIFFPKKVARQLYPFCKSKVWWRK